MDISVRDAICDMGYEDSIVFDNPSYDEAIIGVTDCGKIVYNYDTMIECLMKNENMTEEEAADFISYNTIRSTYYIENSPVVMYPLVM